LNPEPQKKSKNRGGSVNTGAMRFKQFAEVESYEDMRKRPLLSKELLGPPRARGQERSSPSAEPERGPYQPTEEEEAALSAAWDKDTAKQKTLENVHQQIKQAGIDVREALKFLREKEGLPSESRDRLNWARRMKLLQGKAEY
jgi:hypothetical protein